MPRKARRVRIAVIFIAVAFVAFAAVKFVSYARQGRQTALPVGVNIGATDTLVEKTAGDGNADPGDVLKGTITATNTGDTATGVTVATTLPSELTLNASTVKASPVAADDSYTAPTGTVTISTVATGVLGNDFGLPAPTITTVGSCASSPFTNCDTSLGGTVSVNADGTFTYTKKAGTSGTDTFAYTLDNGITPPNATDAAATVSITLKTDQTITFTSTAPANAKLGGPTYTVTATASSGLTVALTIDASASSVCSISGSTVSFTGVGTCVVDADQPGDTTYNAAPQAQQSFAVGKGDQTISFTSTAPVGAKVAGPTYTVTATASSGLTPAFTIDASASSVCSISGSTVSFTGAGTCVIDANQAGDSSYNAAPQVQQPFAVAKGDQTVSFTSTAPVGAKVAGPTYTVTGTASSGLPVTFTIDATASSVCSISGSTVSFTGAGTCKIDANQAGNSNYNSASQVQQSFTVAKGDQTITFTSTAPSNALAGGPTYTVTATATSGLTVAFTIDASATTICSISGSTVTFNDGGTCIINANQAGNTNYNAAPQVQQSFEVDQVPTAVKDPNPDLPSNSTPGSSPYHIALNGSIGGTVNLVTNDDRGLPLADIDKFGPSSGTETSVGTQGTSAQGGNLTVFANGTFNYTPPSATFTGLDTFKYRLANSVGSSIATVTIAVGVRPATTNDSAGVTGNIKIDTSRTGYSALTNDTGDQLTASLVSATNGTATVSSNGTFTFNPTAGYVGAATITYNATNGFGSVQGTVNLTVSNMIWFVDNSKSAGDGRLTSPFNCLVGTGCFSSSGAAAGSTGDTIFIYTGSGSYTGGLTLKNNQLVIGQGANQSITTITGFTPAAGSDTLPTTTVGTNPSITTSAATTNGFTLGTGNVFRGITIGNVTGSAISGNAFGTLTVGPATGSSDVTINGNGQALNLTNGNLAVTFASITSSGGTNNIALSTGNTTLTGTLTINGGALSGASGDAFVISGTGTSTATVSDSGTIASGSAHSINIANKSGGTVTFSGAVSDTDTGITLTNNTNATINFTGGISASTGTSAAFTATGGGTVSATQNNPTIVNTLATTTGTALNVSSTTIGASGLTFQSISAGTAASGPTNGIVLSSTGSSGGLTITGDGTNNASGGTIQKTSGDGISLSSTMNVSLTSMSIQNTVGSGVSGSNNVQNFSFINGTINNSGTGDNTTFRYSNIGFNAGETAPTVGNEKNISGTLTVTGSTLTNAFFHGVVVYQYDGTLSNINISNNTITSSTSQSTSKGQGIKLIGFGSASTVANFSKATIDNNHINNMPSDAGILIEGGNGSSSAAPAGTYGSDISTNAIKITNNTIAGQDSTHPMGTQGILVATNGRGTGNFVITGNSITDVLGIGIGTGSNGLTTATFIITGNTINAHNTNSSGGITGGTTNTFSGNDTPIYNAKIGDGTAGGANHISNTNGAGIFVNTIDAKGLSNVRILTNTVGTPTDGSGTEEGIKVNSGTPNSVNDAVCLEISGNTTAGDSGGGLTAPGIGLRRNHQPPPDAVFGIVGLPAGSTATPNVENYVNGLNPGSASGNFGVGGTVLIGGTTGFSSCSEPGSIAVNTQQGLYEDTLAKNGDSILRSVGLGEDRSIIGDFYQKVEPPFAVRSQPLGTDNADIALAEPVVNVLGEDAAQVDLANSDTSGQLTVDNGQPTENKPSLLAEFYQKLTTSVEPTVDTQSVVVASPDATAAVALLGGGASAGAIDDTSTPIGGMIAMSSASEPTLGSGAATAEALVNSDSNGQLTMDGGRSLIAELFDKLTASIEPTVYSKEASHRTTKSRSATLSPATLPTICIDNDTNNATCAGPGFTLPHGKSITITYEATVKNGPFASGVDNLADSTTISWTGPTSGSTPASGSIALDAAPDLSVTADDSGATKTQPGVTIPYTISWGNTHTPDTSLQAASGAVISFTLPDYTTLNTTGSPDWTCTAASPPIPSTCTTTITGPIAAGATGNVPLVLNVNGALPAAAAVVTLTPTIAETTGIHDNGTDLDTSNNSSVDTDLIIGVWTGAVSSNMGDPNNWSNDMLPTPGQNISIPGDALHPPTFTGTTTFASLYLSGNLTLGPGARIIVTSLLSLGPNKITGEGTVEIKEGATITRTTGQIDCLLQKDFASGAFTATAAGFAGPGAPNVTPTTFTYPVGDFSGYYPVDVTTASTGTLTVSTTQGDAGTVPPLDHTKTLQRYWTFAPTGTILADLTFTYAGSIIDGNEANYRPQRVAAGASVAFGDTCGGNACVDQDNDFIYVPNVTLSNANWTASDSASITTAAEVDVSGRVVSAAGTPLRGVRITLDDGTGHPLTVISNAFGYYHFDAVRSGLGYLVSASGRGLAFTPRVVIVNDQLTDLDLTALP